MGRGGEERLEWDQAVSNLGFLRKKCETQLFFFFFGKNASDTLDPV